MTPQTAQTLRDLNQQFYCNLADPFAASRAAPQPGFALLLDWLPVNTGALLDVGCGNGRFGHYLLFRQPPWHYVGVDFSTRLLQKGRALLYQATFYQRDMTQPGFLADLGLFDAIACLAAMQHVPGHASRLALLQEMVAHLRPDGRLFLSNWQFMSSPRQRRKVRPWSEIGLTPADVESNDYLLTWQRDGFGLRYACQIDEAETAVLAAQSGLHILHQFRSDGQEGDLSLYTVLQK